MTPMFAESWAIAEPLPIISNVAVAIRVLTFVISLSLEWLPNSLYPRFSAFTSAAGLSISTNRAKTKVLLLTETYRRGRDGRPHR